jgi:carbamoyltransferase
MNIVGVNISHDTSVCLMQDGKIIFYLEEERLCKIKSYITLDVRRPIQTLSKLKKYINHVDYLIITTFGRDLENNLNYDFIIGELLVNQLLKLNITIDKVILDAESHHLHHAHNAFYFSGFESAVVLVMDDSGSILANYSENENDKLIYAREIESIYKFNNNSHKKIFKHYSNFSSMYERKKLNYKSLNDSGNILSNSASVGRLFALVTKGILGLHYLDAGKTMGMSSYGNLDKEKIEWFSEHKNNVLFDCTFLVDLAISKIYLSASFKEQADLAKKLQYETKEYTIRLIQKAIDLSDSNNVVLSGGYFQNCVNNYAYLKAFPNINFYADPICYDGGTAIGACLYVWHHILGSPNTLQKLDNLYLGPE